MYSAGTVKSMASIDTGLREWCCGFEVAGMPVRIVVIEPAPLKRELPQAKNPLRR
jgi:hypothetical protein